MFIGGVMLAVATGDQAVRAAQELDLLIAGIVRGIGAEAAQSCRGQLAHRSVVLDEGAPEKSGESSRIDPNCSL
jgi:hypothetical protein